METTTPNTDAKTGTLHLPRQGAANSGSLQTSRFPARAQDTGPEGPANLETKIRDVFSGDWADSARNEVRKHPLAIVGVALVAGLLVGRL